MNARLLLLFALTLVVQGVHADWQTRSWSRWDIGAQGAEAVIGIDRIELERLGLVDDQASLGKQVDRSVAFLSAGVACPVTAVEPQAAPSTLLMLRVVFRCSAPLQSPQIRVRLLFGSTGQPLHYASVIHADVRSDALLTRGADTFDIAEAAAQRRGTEVLRDYLYLGFVHILEGLDHVAFLLCLLLAAPGLTQRLWLVTGFTLGHSITLSLAALGLLRVHGAGVEALIGFTVALLAAEVFQRRHGWRTPVVLLLVVIGAMLLAVVSGLGPGLPVATLGALLVLAPAYLLLAQRSVHADRLHLGMVGVFGLVHGLGFAAVLRSIGLPAGSRGWALAGFNLGVELGQLLLLLAFAGLLAAGTRIAGERRADEACSALASLLCATGVFWLVQRGL